MSNVAAATGRPLNWLHAAETRVVLLVASTAWLATVVVARGMGAMPGTMGLGFAGFVGVWTLMMAAMMLPSVAPFASLYSRAIADHRLRRVATLLGGYLAVWAAIGGLVFALAAGADRLAGRAPGWAHALAVTSCVACALYQMTGVKDRCLQHCRSPLGHLLRYTALRGRLVELRVGVQHGAWCLACCWSLMLLLVTFGVMNVTAMVVLAAVVVVEKVVPTGRWFSVAVGCAALALALAVWRDPALAPGLHAHRAMDMGG